MSRTLYALVHYTHPIVKGLNPGVRNLIYKKEKMLLILYAVCLKILLLHFHRSKFEMAKMTERVQSYDTWGKQEYDYSVQVRYKAKQIDYLQSGINAWCKTVHVLK